MSAEPRVQPELRRMQVADVEGVMRVEREAYVYPWTARIFEDCLRVGYDCWVLAVDGRQVGHSVLTVAAGEAHLLNLTVDPRWQGNGLGRFMVRRLFDYVCSQDAEALFLEVRPSNVAAVQLYRSEGFEHIGTRPRYYPLPSGREDAWVLTRRCAAPAGS
ncbi:MULTISPECIES: ribosomal protein S18-alanine N-acetyltransferase [Thioalkalivibrio]|uniref:[Ribosomal protein bS18]-alanine N-acetyltransferase n=1 Tax=Thioalkalivibrio versutus TaxID=106634 RepID=A0A0G3GAC8_9GAMM|nr:MULTISPECIES: ribosomal protein S18-alanine N-acetyltransferase [Thioalkalivibrio]AKJ95756.1 alanine acetyltransferase [Thioalkalivibrio versutus]OOC48976.1 ribosomal-protein-alanine N-acetyltransferase RimI [Thioalkalivibrio versutus]